MTLEMEGEIWNKRYWMGFLCADEETLTKYLRAALQRRKEFLQGGDILYHELTKEQVAHISEISKYAQEICENEKELQVV